MSSLLREGETFPGAARAAGVLQIPDLGHQRGDFTLQKKKKVKVMEKNT